MTSPSLLVGLHRPPSRDGNVSEPTSTSIVESQPSTTERLRDARTLFDRLRGDDFDASDRHSATTSDDADARRSTGSSATSNDDDYGREVVLTTTVLDERRADTTREDFLEDRRTSATAGASSGALGTIAAGIAVGGPMGATIVAGGAVLGGAIEYIDDTRSLSERVVTTTVTDEDGVITRTTEGDERLAGNETIDSTTTTTTEYGDGTVEHSVFDSTTGVERATSTDGNGVTTVSVSRPDNAAANSPRTTVTYDENGTVVSRTVTSPTGGVYDVPVDAPTVEPEPEPEPEPERERPRERRRGTNDNNSRDVGGGGSSYTSPASTTGSNGMHGGGT